MKRKLISVLLCLAMTVSLTACGSAGNEAASTVPAEESSEGAASAGRRRHLRKKLRPLQRKRQEIMIIKLL